MPYKNLTCIFVQKNYITCQKQEKYLFNLISYPSSSFDAKQTKIEAKATGYPTDDEESDDITYRLYLITNNNEEIEFNRYSREEDAIEYQTQIEQFLAGYTSSTPLVIKEIDYFTDAFYFALIIYFLVSLLIIMIWDLKTYWKIIYGLRRKLFR